MKNIKDLVFKLCSIPGVSGFEKNISKFVLKEISKYAKTYIDQSGNVIATIGNLDSNKNIILDAHIDQVGFIVTFINKKGFLKISSCGGIDQRILPGSILQIYGKKIINGIVISTPPHLSYNKKNKNISEIYVDTGLNQNEIKDVVSLGDSVSFLSKPKTLLNNRIVAPALDNRASISCLICCAEMLSQIQLDHKITLILSVQEETGGLGAKIGAYHIMADEAIVVDVSFASQPGISEEKTGDLSAGPMIGIAPSLSQDVYKKLIEVSKMSNIKYQLEIMSGNTGTNSDLISISKSGIKCGLISIPQRYMHTSNEIVDLDDIENTAKLISIYAKQGGTF